MQNPPLRTAHSNLLVFKVGAQTGVGHNLMSILSYAVLCRKLSRTLVLDVRDFKYLPDAQNTFTDHFSFEGDGWPNVELDPSVIDEVYRSPDRLDFVYEEELIDSIPSGLQGGFFNQRTVVIPSRYHESNNANANIRFGLRGDLKEAFEQLRRTHFSGKPVIGIHFRHGNGEWLDGRPHPDAPDFEERYQSLRDEYLKAVLRIQSSMQDQCRVLICSDNLAFRDDIREHIPRAFCVASQVPQIPHLTVNAHNDPAACKDAILDLWCLGECDFLLSTSSSFAAFARRNSRKSETISPVSLPIGSLPASVPDLPETRLIRDTLCVRLYLRNAPVTFDTYAKILDIAGQRSESALAKARAEHLNYHERSDWRFSLFLVSNRQIDPAISLISQSAAQTDNPFIWSHLADLFFVAGHFPEALQAISKAIELDSGWPWFHSVQSKIFHSMGKRQQCSHAAEHAVQIAPHSALLQTRLLYVRAVFGDGNKDSIGDVRKLAESLKLGMSFWREPGFFQ